MTLLQQHRCNSNLVICIVSGTESLWRGTTSWLWHKATDRCRRRDNTISCSFLFIDVINRQRLSSFRIDIEDAGYNRWLTNALINGSFVSTFSRTQYSIEKVYSDRLSSFVGNVHFGNNIPRTQKVVIRKYLYVYIMCLASSSVRATKHKLTNSHQACIFCQNIGARNCVDIFFEINPYFSQKIPKIVFDYLLQSTVLTTFCKNSRPYYVLRFGLQLIPHRGVL